MPNCANDKVTFGRVGLRVVEAAFEGGNIVSDGGAILLRQVDQRIGLNRATAAVFKDARRPANMKNGMREMLAQRIYALCCGWQDVADHNTVCRDLVLQTAVGTADELASGNRMLAPARGTLKDSASGAKAWAQRSTAAFRRAPSPIGSLSPGLFRDRHGRALRRTKDSARTRI